MNTFVIHQQFQQLMNTLATETWSIICNRSHQLDQRLVLAGLLETVTLRTARLIQDTARLSLRDLIVPQTTAYNVNRSTPPFGADQFGRAASFKINMSNAWSATNFLSREFSFSSSLSCFAICGSIPPYLVRQR